MSVSSEWAARARPVPYRSRPGLWPRGQSSQTSPGQARWACRSRGWQSQLGLMSRGNGDVEVRTVPAPPPSCTRRSCSELVHRGGRSPPRRHPGAGADAAAAAHAAVVVDPRHRHGHDLAAPELALARLVKGHGAVGTDALARVAPDAPLGLHRAACRAACCSILPAREPPPMPRFFMQPPKPALVVALEVREGDHDVRVHEGVAYLASFTYSPFFTGTSVSSVPLRAVGDDHLAAGGVGREAVLIRTVECSRAFLRLPT